MSGSADKKSPEDMLSMSDDAFKEMGTPPVVEDEEEDPAANADNSDADADDASDKPTADAGNVDDKDDTTPEETSEEDGVPDEDDSSGSDSDGDADPDADDADEPDDADAKADADKEDVADPTAGSSKKKKPEGDAKKGDKPADDAESKKADDSADSSPNYKAFYDQMMGPFKANGKTIQLKTPEEALSLMQMGANYTKKLQDIQPHRKVLLMLENNGILDEGKLSRLIDLDKKDPEAIKQLVRDAGIDPLEIDVDAESEYIPNSHSVSDEQANFQTTLQDIAGQPDGKETLVAIDSTWDKESKQAVWNQPAIMTIIHQQRESGMYDRVVAEVDRLRTLGSISADTPFLKAYKDTGEAMEKSGQLADLDTDIPGKAPVVQEPPKKVAEKTIAPKSKLSNGDKAKSAASSRNSPRAAKKLVNPLAMSDDDFLNSLKDRI